MKRVAALIYNKHHFDDPQQQLVPLNLSTRFDQARFINYLRTILSQDTTGEINPLKHAMATVVIDLFRCNHGLLTESTKASLIKLYPKIPARRPTLNCFKTRIPSVLMVMMFEYMPWKFIVNTMCFVDIHFYEFVKKTSPFTRIYSSEATDLNNLYQITDNRALSSIKVLSMKFLSPHPKVFRLYDATTTSIVKGGQIIPYLNLQSLVMQGCVILGATLPKLLDTLSLILCKTEFECLNYSLCSHSLRFLELVDVTNCTLPAICFPTLHTLHISCNILDRMNHNFPKIPRLDCLRLFCRNYDCVRCDINAPLFVSRWSHISYLSSEPNWSWLPKIDATQMTLETHSVETFSWNVRLMKQPPQSVVCQHNGVNDFIILSPDARFVARTFVDHSNSNIVFTIYCKPKHIPGIHKLVRPISDAHTRIKRTLVVSGQSLTDQHVMQSKHALLVSDACQTTYDGPSIEYSASIADIMTATKYLISTNQASCGKIIETFIGHQCPFTTTQHCCCQLI